MKYEGIGKFYASMIIRGKMEFKNVPDKFKPATRAMLKEMGWDLIESTSAKE
jgi:hypothetical protein